METPRINNTNLTDFGFEIPSVPTVITESQLDGLHRRLRHRQALNEVHLALYCVRADVESIASGGIIDIDSLLANRPEDLAVQPGGLVDLYGDDNDSLLALVSNLLADAIKAKTPGIFSGLHIRFVSDSRIEILGLNLTAANLVEVANALVQDGRLEPESALVLSKSTDLIFTDEVEFSEGDTVAPIYGRPEPRKSSRFRGRSCGPHSPDDDERLRWPRPQSIGTILRIPRWSKGNILRVRFDDGTRSWVHSRWCRILPSTKQKAGG